MPRARERLRANRQPFLAPSCRPIRVNYCTYRTAFGPSECVLRFAFARTSSRWPEP